MDKYGPNIYELGDLSAIYTSSVPGWSSGYPKVYYSYGLDASSTLVKANMGLFTYQSH